ncbi:MAG: hypothetical protein JW779_13180 [Candidatus Thorarchaeota archaeon]|nr:hypothetical protein [Candidatus Thorarchaeota archaeon]
MIVVPHTGVIDESLEGEEELLMRARLHVRASKQRLSRGQRRDAIAAMYDAIASAMLRYVISDSSDDKLRIQYGEDLSNDSVLFNILKRSNVLDGTITPEDFDYIEHVLDEALENDVVSYNESRFMEIATNLLTQLQIIPFDENILPETSISP